jgi:hypothetical protein
VILAWGGVGWQAETAGSVTTTAKILTNILCPLPSAPVHPFVQPTVHFLSLSYLFDFIILKKKKKKKKPVVDS